MGKRDLAGKIWLSDRKRYADLFNGTVFRGKQIVRPEDLELINSEADVILTDKNGKNKGIQRYRDIVMNWKGKANLAVFACENQSKVHYAMPVRMMIYDGLTYADQIKQIWEKHHEAGDVDMLDSEEWLSHFGKDDSLVPVIPLVFYYGSKAWQASTSLHGMFQLPEVLEESEILETFIPNYRINLIDAGNIEHIEHFQTDLQVLFQMLKCRGKKEELLDYVNKNRVYFSRMDRETFQAFREFLQAGALLQKAVPKNSQDGGKVDMCKALQDLYDDGVEQGIERKLQEQVEKKLAKGKSVEVIADELEETTEHICKVIEYLSECKTAPV